jgi:hypothetical protein
LLIYRAVSPAGDDSAEHGATRKRRWRSMHNGRPGKAAISGTARAFRVENGGCWRFA